MIVASWFPSILDPVAGRFVADQAEALQRAAARVRVVSFDEAGLVGSARLRTDAAAAVEAVAAAGLRGSFAAFSSRGSASRPGIPVARLAVPAGRTRLDPVLHAARYRSTALLRLFERPDVTLPDVIHAHTGYPDGVAAADLADRLGVPLVITEHATFLDRLFAVAEIRAAYVRAAQRATRLIVVSETFADELRESVPELRDRLHVVPNVVDVDSISIGHPDERRHGELLFIGYWKEVKGIDVLLRAVARLRESRPDISLRLIGQAGNAELDRRWRSLATDLGIADAVSFEPPQGRAGVAAALRRADVFVHASRRETFGVVAAEALAAGLPVVAADSGAVPEIVGRGAEALGAVVLPDDPEAFATAVRDVLDRRSEFDPVALRSTVEARYAPARVAQQLLEVYSAAVIGDASWTPPSAGTSRVVHGPAAGSVALALDPDRASALGGVAAAFRPRIVVVTSAAPDRPPLEGFKAVVQASLADRVRALEARHTLGPKKTGWRRIAAGLRHPLAAARRLGVIPGLEQLLFQEVTPAIVRSVDLFGEGSAPAVVAADGLDYLVLAPLVRDGRVKPAPGGLRWLGDQASDGGDGPDPSSRARTASAIASPTIRQS
jgi:glycogen(starch) synthase